MLNKRAAAEQLRKYAAVARLVREQRMMQKRAEQQSGTSNPKKPKSPSDPVAYLRSWINWAVQPTKPSVEGTTRDGTLRGVMLNGNGDAIRNWHEFSKEKEKYERNRKVQPK